MNNKDDLDYFMKSNLPLTYIKYMLKTLGKSKEEISSFSEKYEKLRHKLQKHLSAFFNKIQVKHPDLEGNAIMQKAIKYATKNNMPENEKEAFLNVIVKGDVNTSFIDYESDINKNMAEFFGYEIQGAPQIDIKATDQSTLNEIAELYLTNQKMYMAVRDSIYSYTGFAPEAIGFPFDKSTFSQQSYIHPVLVALFFPKIQSIEKRMLETNIGRMVVHRAQQYFLTKHKNLSINQYTTQNEIIADIEFVSAIAQDPYALNYLENKDTPIQNLLKRYKIQIALWKSVLYMRHGMYFSKKTDDYIINDNISEFMTLIKSYDWSFIDNSDNYYSYDEGALLRKLLATFSICPTTTQVSKNIDAAMSSKFMKIPIINVDLPDMQIGTNDFTDQPITDLLKSLDRKNWYVEHKMIVPKTKSVISSKDLLFFSINRYRHSVTYTQNQPAIDIQYVGFMPNIGSHNVVVNSTLVMSPELLSIGKNDFVLRSAVVANPPDETTYGKSFGCSAYMIKYTDILTHFYCYDPIKVQNNYTNTIVKNNNHDEVSGIISKYGTLLIYEALQTKI